MEYCIFNSKKGCTDCGECDRCDLNSNKKCNNCGKCLELEGFDIKAIKIDEIVDNRKESREIEDQLNKSSVKKSNNESYYQLISDEAEEVISDDESLTELYDDYDDENNKPKEDVLEYKDEMDDNLVYIDDVDGLSEMMEEDKISEMYPGVLRYDREGNYNN